MSKNVFIAGIFGLIFGALIGFTGANYLNQQNMNQAQSQPNAQPLGGGTVPGGQPGGAQQLQPGMIEDVQKTLDFAKNNPKSIEAQLEAGEMYFKIGKLDEALAFYQKGLEIDVKSTQANNALGKVYFEKKEYDTAGKHFVASLEVDAKQPGPRSDLGLSYYLRDPKDVDSAISNYKKALDIDPKFELALQNLAVALKEKGEKEEFKKTLDALKVVNPNNTAIPKLTQQ